MKSILEHLQNFTDERISRSTNYNNYYYIYSTSLEDLADSKLIQKM